MPNFITLNLITAKYQVNFSLTMHRSLEVFTGWMFYVLYCIFYSLEETVSHKSWPFIIHPLLYQENVACVQFQMTSFVYPLQVTIIKSDFKWLCWYLVSVLAALWCLWLPEYVNKNTIGVLYWLWKE